MLYTKQCLNCDKPFSSPHHNTRYCCTSCKEEKIKKRAVINTREWRKLNFNLCQACDKKILKESTFCQACSKSKSNYDYKSMKLKDYIGKPNGKFAANKYSDIRQFCRSWNKFMVGLPCQKCNYSLHTELCHIKAISSFNEDTLLGTINDKDNIIVLCPNCHWELDSGHISIDQVKSNAIKSISIQL